MPSGTTPRFGGRQGSRRTAERAHACGDASQRTRSRDLSSSGGLLLQSLGFAIVWGFRRSEGSAFAARLIEGHELVTSGPFAYVRHPIYSALLGLQIATGPALAQAWATALGVAI